MILYAALPAQLSGPLISPQLAFTRCVAALARAVIDALNIDEIRWPLAGVKVTSRASMAACRRSFAPMSSRWATLRCIWTVRRAIFCPTAAAGSGATGRGHPMQARWDVKGSGSGATMLSSLSTGFDKLEYGTMRVSTRVDPRAADPLAARC